MTEPPVTETEAPPAGEQIHMPGPSVLPLLNAFGLALTIISITLGTFLLVAGITIFVVTTVIWIRAAVRETNELPLEHGSH